MAALVCALIGATCASVFRRLPSVMTESSPPRKTDAVVVLGGDVTGLRVERAAELLRDGMAPTLVVSGGSVYRETTYAELMRRHAIQLGVQAEAIVVQDRSMTTREDAAFTVEVLRARGARSAIVVTSPWHSSRAMKLFREAGPTIEWISCPSQQEWAGDWWRNSGSARSVVYEVLKRLWPE